jgi:hypothetical protein
MALEIGNGTITGLVAGGLPDRTITATEIGYPGNIVNTVYVQTRTQASYSAPVSGNGTAIALVNLTITPKKAGNKIILKWMLHNEAGYNSVYTITRNGTPLAGATNVSGATGNRWSGIVTNNYDNNTSSTPVVDTIYFVDNSSLATATTYSICIRSSNGTANTYYLNRPYSSAGADNYEAGVSTGVAHEVYV